MFSRSQLTLARSLEKSTKYLASETSSGGAFLVSRLFRPNLHVSASSDGLITVRHGSQDENVYKEGLLVGSVDMPLITGIYVYTDSDGRFLCHRGAELLEWDLSACFIRDLGSYARAAKLGLTTVAQPLESVAQTMFKTA